MLRELLNVEEVSKICKLSKKTVMSLTRAGKLPGFKLGKSWRFDADRLNQWIEQEVNNRILRIHRRRSKDALRTKRQKEDARK